MGGEEASRVWAMPDQDRGPNRCHNGRRVRAPRHGYRAWCDRSIRQHHRGGLIAIGRGLGAGLPWRTTDRHEGRGHRGAAQHRIN